MKDQTIEGLLQRAITHLREEPLACRHAPVRFPRHLCIAHPEAGILCLECVREHFTRGHVEPRRCLRCEKEGRHHEGSELAASSIFAEPIWVRLTTGERTVLAPPIDLSGMHLCPRCSIVALKVAAG